MAQKEIKKADLHKKLGTFQYAQQGDVKNEIILYFEHGSICQSYTSLVAYKVREEGHMSRLYFSRKHDYSNTTNKHVLRFCGLTLPERRKALESGEATMVIDL